MQEAISLKIQKLIEEFAHYKQKGKELTEEYSLDQGDFEEMHQSFELQEELETEETE